MEDVDRAGVGLRIYNRTASKAESLVALGVQQVESPTPLANLLGDLLKGSAS